MVHFLARVYKHESTGYFPVFPDLNHKRPDFQEFSKKKLMKKPALVDDDLPPNHMRDDCIFLSHDKVRELLSSMKSDPPLQEDSIMLDITSLIRFLYPLIKKHKNERDQTQHSFLSSLLRIAAEGRYVGGTHFVMTPVA